MGRLFEMARDVVVQRGPRFVEDGLQQATLSPEIANELRLRRAGIAGDRGRGGLLISQAAEERFAGGEQAVARTLRDVRFGHAGKCMQDVRSGSRGFGTPSLHRLTALVVK